MRVVCAMALISCGVVLSGCMSTPMMTTSTSTPTNPVQGAALQGRVHGGQQPIVGASVYLYAADATGYGKASDSLLKSPGYVTTDSNGNFTITGDYTCPSANTQVYLYAVGGDPTPGVPNSAAGLLAGLGSCSSLKSTTFIFMNEVSTIATAYSIAGFATDATHVSSSGSSLALTGVANAFSTIPNLEMLGTGAALATSPGGIANPPQSEMNTLANILAACINSTGPSSTPCTTLLSSALSGGTTGTQPTDTATAAIYLAHNPAVNTTTLYGLQTASSPFQPDLGSAPDDFSVQISFPTTNNYGFFTDIAIDGSGNIWVVGGFGSAGDGLGEILANTLMWSSTTPMVGGGMSTGSPSRLAIDASENVWSVTNNAPGSQLVEVNSGGTVQSGSGGYSDGFQDATPLVVDGSGNVWVPGNFNTMFEYIPGTGWANTTGFGGGYFNQPGEPAVDASGNIWVPNNASGNGFLTELSSSGAVLCPTSKCFTGGGLYAGVAAAVDPSGNIWVTNNGLGPATVSKFSSSGSPLSPSGGYTATDWAGTAGIAVDGAGNVFVPLGGGNGNPDQLAELSPSGAILSGPNGYGQNTNLGGTNAVAIDLSGNVWTTNPGSYFYIDEFVGLGAPTVTPKPANLKSPYGSHAVNLP